MPLPDQFSLGLYHGNIGVEGIREGVAKWRPLIISALKNHDMTSDELVSNLLAECYYDIDNELNFILSALDDLRDLGALRVSKIMFNRESKKVDTYLTLKFYSASNVY